MPGSTCLVANAQEMTGDLPKPVFHLITYRQKHVLFNGTYSPQSFKGQSKSLERKYENLKVDIESQNKTKLSPNKYRVLFKALRNSTGVPNPTIASYLIKFLTSDF